MARLRPSMLICASLYTTDAIAVASLGQMKVIKVNYRGGGPSIPGNEVALANFFNRHIE